MAGAISARFALLGTGNSTAVPWLQCMMNEAARCKVCASCLEDPQSKNRRNNVSALLTVKPPVGNPHHIMIDCGKTFRDTALRQWPHLGVQRLSAVVLTHPHADAIMGLDDLRDASPYNSLPVYCSQDTFQAVSRAFPYLVQSGLKPPGTFVAKLEWNIVRDFEPFLIADTGVICVPLPVLHGSSPCFAFEFQCIDRTVAQASADKSVETGSGAGASVQAGHGHGHGQAETDANAGPGMILSDLDSSFSSSSSSDGHVPSSTSAASDGHGHGHKHGALAGDRLVYVSDVHALPRDTHAYLTSPGRGRIHSLFLDALSYRRYPTHFSFKQAVVCARDLQPARAVLIGMSHRVDYELEHPKLQTFGQERCGGMDLGMGHDGWSIDFDLGVSDVQTVRTAVEAVLPHRAATSSDAQLHTQDGAAGHDVPSGLGCSALSESFSDLGSTHSGHAVDHAVAHAAAAHEHHGAHETHATVAGTSRLSISTAAHSMSMGMSTVAGDVHPAPHAPAAVVHDHSISDGDAGCGCTHAQAAASAAAMTARAAVERAALEIGALNYLDADLQDFEEASSPSAAPPLHSI